jgi:hypothetical protein
MGITSPMGEICRGDLVQVVGPGRGHIGKTISRFGKSFLAYLAELRLNKNRLGRWLRLLRLGLRRFLATLFRNNAAEHTE